MIGDRKIFKYVLITYVLITRTAKVKHQDTIARPDIWASPFTTWNCVDYRNVVPSIPGGHDR